MLRLFVNPELIKWSGLCEIYETELRSTEVFTASTEDGRKRWDDLKNRVVEHVRHLKLIISFILFFLIKLIILFSLTEYQDNGQVLYQHNNQKNGRVT